ncbi:MAG: NUDIX hydrolase [Candidatus Omnitrophica bacterium]|nr:NUDIX hydrolase [Candidatus Omnitrophota bacterium]
MTLTARGQAKGAQFKSLGWRSIFRGRVFELKKVATRAPSGHEFEHDVIDHPGAAVIVPLLKPDQLVLVQQYRVAVGRMIWEFPAGTLEQKEAPLSCAKRELIEETGFAAKKWRKLVSFYPAPGISTEFMHVFLASHLVPKPSALDQDEFLERKVVSFSRLQDMIFNGSIVDAKTIIGFFYYCHKRNERVFHRIR